MSVRASALAVLLLLTAVACSTGGGSAPSMVPSAGGADGPSGEAKVEPEAVAERLLTQLRDEDYAAAYETLSTGQARDVAADQLDLRTKMMSANTLVRAWSLEEPAFITVDEQSKVEITGTVTYDDDGTGGVRIVMQAIGLVADPWRVDEFELTRDGPVSGDAASASPHPGA